MSATAASFGDELDALGIWWPKGDGDALRVSADDWRAMADLLEEITQVLDAVVASVVAHHDGEAARRFAELWSQWSGPTGHLQVTTADCRRLAAALEGFGTDVDVADRALLAAAEQALDELLRALTPADVAAWTAWLHETSGAVRDDLAGRAVARVDALAALGSPLTPNQPHEPVPAMVDPDRIAWPDPGTPRDLSTLATTPVDLGAGQGTLAGTIPGGSAPVGGAPLLPGPSIDVSGSAAPGALPSGSGTSVIVIGNTGTVTVTVGAPSVAVPTPTMPPIGAPVQASLPNRLPTPVGRGAPATPVELTPVAPTLQRTVPTTAMPLLDRTWTPTVPDATPAPSLAPLDPASAIGGPRPVPITVQPPAAAVPVAPMATAGAAAVVAAAAAKKSSSGFLPMMPMGGGGPGGDEGPEPRRRRYRLR